uniref:Thymocyte selection associated family member 2 n=1 Tax=Sinocyclocheilus grahami TaxID=75366 RepID=A0A672S9V1_SINGR
MGDLQALRVFISCLDQQSLPRILQVCSGVYFQGSIYELSGSEVCLSTGDLLKIIGLELLSVSCEEIETGASFELPTGYSGEPLNNTRMMAGFLNRRPVREKSLARANFK